MAENETAGAELKLIIFKLGREEYGLDITQVNTIEKDLEIIKADNLPKNIKITG